MKLLTSQCGKAWLFNVTMGKEIVEAGLACFLPGCADRISIEAKGKQWEVEVPYRIVRSPVPTKISNARLSVIL
jgi:hypothetical protein